MKKLSIKKWKKKSRKNVKEMRYDHENIHWCGFMDGTNVRAAVVKEDGTILCMNKDESHPEKGAEAVMKTMISLIKGLDGYENCKGIGMGIPGPMITFMEKSSCLRICRN